MALLSGCNTATLTEQRRESIERHLSSIHYMPVYGPDEKQLSAIRPTFCATDEVQSLASPVFVTSGERTAALLEHSKDVLRVCQGCAVKAAGLALWQPIFSPAIARHSVVFGQYDGHVIYDTDLDRDEHYRTKEAPTGLYFGGTAVPITEDGYFLTAAHVLDKSPQKPSGQPEAESAEGAANDSRVATAAAALTPVDFHVACVTADGKPTLARARVVWLSATSTGERPSTRHSEPAPDLAIFHADIQPARIAVFAEPDDVKPDVLVVGGRALQFTDFYGHTFPQCAGGIARAELVEHDGHRYTLLVTYAPAAPGDSGGPMVTTKGQLVGIATNNNQLLDGNWVSAGWILPQAEIFAIVDADRLSQAGK